MHLLSLVCRNYRQFAEAQLEFVDGITGIIGNNGAGKSTLIEAIAFALYGPLAARTIKENIKRESASKKDDVQVTLCWETRGSNFEVVRTLKGERLSPTVEFKVNGVLQAHSAKGVQTAIEHTVGLDWQAFYASFFARQKELNALSELQSSARKELIVRMLRIDSVDKAIDRVKEDVKEQRMRRDLLAQKLVDLPALEQLLKGKISELEALREKLNTSAQILRTSEQEFQKTKKLYEQEKKQAVVFQERSNSLNQAKSTLKRISDQLVKAKQEQEKLAYEPGAKEKNTGFLKAQQVAVETLRQELEAIRLKKGEYEANRSILEARYKELVKKEQTVVALGPDANCPTCGRTLSGDFKSIKEHFSAERDQVAAEGATWKNKILDQAHLEKELQEKYKVMVLSIDKLSKELERSVVLETKKTQLDNVLKELSAEEQKQQKAVGVSEEALSKLSFNLKQYAELEKNFLTLLDKHDQVRESHQKIVLAEALLTQEVEQFKAQFALGQKEALELESCTTALTECQALSSIFLDFRTYLISKIRPTLSSIASDLLRQITEGKYSAIELDEDYEMLIEEHGVFYPLQRFSGGEVDVANLCLRIAIAHYVAEQHGTETGFIVLDEIFGGQDYLRMRTIMEALGALTKRFRQIILISHIDEVKEAVGQVISVVEDEAGISHVEN